MTAQMNLGQLIQALEGAVQWKPVYFKSKFRLIPTSFRSWRGNYAHLALGYRTTYEVAEGVPPTIGGLLAAARYVDGGTTEGYKGGLFRMSQATPIWVDNWGEYNRVALVDACLNRDGEMALVAKRL